MKITKGKCKIIYKKEGTTFKSYHLKIIGFNERHISAVDLQDREKEKTFNITRVVEILDEPTSDDLIKEKLERHIENYNQRKLPSSFVHGSFFSRAKGHVSSDGSLVLKLKGSRQTLERDIKVFKLLIYYFQTTGKASVGECKKFVKDAAAGLLGYDSDYEFDDYDFTADGKKELIDNYKDEVSENKDYLKELIQNCKDEGVDPLTDDEVISLKEEIESQQQYLKIIKSDYRQELIRFLCREYYQKYNDSIFHDITRNFPIKF
jgi:hypothetical protein